MEYTIRPAAYIDKLAVIDIFNHYVENTFAAYPQKKVPYEFFDLLMDMAKGYPFYVADTGEITCKTVIGYGLLRPHYRIDTFSRAAELTCFIAPGYVKKGIGTAILNKLIADARAMKVDTILASISSLNEDSIRFHKKYGFTECGTFLSIGKKFDRELDEVWMQLLIR